jgi:hypothetical protein
MMRSLRAYVLVAMIVGWVSPALAAATEVTTCGQTFSGSGFLSADLDCSAVSGDAVVIDGGTLDLRGFTIVGGDGAGVFCSKGCRVKSEPAGGRIINAAKQGVAKGDVISEAPGRTVRLQGVILDGNVGGGVRMFDDGNVVVENTTISNSPANDGVAVQFGRARITNSVIENVSRAVISNKGTRLVDSVVDGCAVNCVDGERNVIVRSVLTGAGEAAVFAGDRLRLVDSTISDSAGNGISTTNTTRIRITGSAITGNGGRGIAGGGFHPFTIKDSNISGNAFEGIFHTSRVRLIRSTVNNNGRSGVNTGEQFMSSCGPVRLVASTVTGNGTDAGVCGVSETCSDVSTCAAPAALTQGSTCGTSYDTDSGFPGTSWGICTLD